MTFYCNSLFRPSEAHPQGEARLSAACLKSRSYAQQGSSLLEVMVAGLLFMVGLLGLLATQGLSLKMATSAVEFDAAAGLMMDLNDRMKANQEGVRQGFYSTANYTSAAIDSMPDCSQVAAECSAEQVAQYDLALWKARLESEFQTGSKAVINKTSATEDQYQVNIIWFAQIDSITGTDGNQTAVSTNCAIAGNRPANERAFCGSLDLSRVAEF